MIFKREPAWWVNLGGVLIVFLGTLFPLTDVQQGWWNAVVASVVGVVVAAMTHDGVVAAAMGLFKAAVVLSAGYGVIPVVHTLSSAQQAALYTVLAAISAAYVRTQVTAKVSASGKAVPPPA